MNLSKLKYGFLALLIAPLVLGNSGCNDESVRKERDEVEKQQRLYVNNQPVPIFDWSLERHLMVELYRARNKAVATYSYVRNQYTGKIMSWCPSIGYPIPANTQLTNPQRVVGSNAVVSQPEPNGLFSSGSTRGTFVMCVNKDGKVVPRYFEGDVEAYLVPMKEDEKNPGMLVEVEGAKPSIEIDPKQPGKK